MADETLNGDLTQIVCVDSAAMAWAPSPSPSVWRKRLHRVGPPESGQVTSVVRYDAGSQFPVHGHPEGEEILVLDGVFSDDRGDWPAGTYLLNPEGYSHAPSSREGCTLFVKLRQFPGLNREQVAIDTDRLSWQPGDQAGISTKTLYAQPGYSDRMRIERWAGGMSLAPREFADGAELFVLDGEFRDAFGSHGPGCWLRLPPGTVHAVQRSDGCTLYLKTGGHRSLR